MKVIYHKDFLKSYTMDPALRMAAWRQSSRKFRTGLR